MNTRIRWKI